MSQDVSTDQTISFLSVGEGEEARDIAFIHDAGKDPGLFWLSGFKSSMEGQKATAIAGWANGVGQSCTRLDYSGHGRSGGDFVEGTISRWLEEALAVLDTTEGKKIIVGSSMGAWIALLLAKARPERMKALILIAPAWDMTKRLMPMRLTDEMQAHLAKHGWVGRPSNYSDDDYIYTQRLLDDGNQNLIGDVPFRLGCPVHILHGRQDPDVPWQHGHALTELLPEDEVRFTLVPDGDHRLSRAEDLALLIAAIESFNSYP